MGQVSVIPRLPEDDHFDQPIDRDPSLTHVFLELVNVQAAPQFAIAKIAHAYITIGSYAR